MNHTDAPIQIATTNLGNRDATIARVTFGLPYFDDLLFVADGTAKRDPHDDDDAEVAFLLAYGRAFETLGRKLQKRANGLNKHNDDIKNYKEVQKAKAAKKKAPKPKVNAARKAKVAAKK